MTFSYYISKVNWQLIITHLVATFFIIIAARQFAILNDPGFIESFDKYGVDNGLKHLAKEDNFPTRLVYFSLWTNLSSFIGVMLAFVISLILTIKRKVFWANAIIVFIMVFLLNRLGLFNNKIIDTIFFHLAIWRLTLGFNINSLQME